MLLISYYLQKMTELTILSVSCIQTLEKRIQEMAQREKSDKHIIDELKRKATLAAREAEEMQKKYLSQKSEWLVKEKELQERIQTTYFSLKSLDSDAQSTGTQSPQKDVR